MRHFIQESKGLVNNKRVDYFRQQNVTVLDFLSLGASTYQFLIRDDSATSMVK